MNSKDMEVSWEMSASKLTFRRSTDINPAEMDSAKISYNKKRVVRGYFLVLFVSGYFIECFDSW